MSVLALALSVLNLALIIGAVPMPTPGIRLQVPNALPDRATYGFEYDTDGWAGRGAAGNPFVTDTHVFVGRTSLGVPVAGLTHSNQGFIYIGQPAGAAPGARMLARLYVSGGTPPLIGALYILDGSWTWANGPFVALSVGQWTALSYTIPSHATPPIREVGVMLLGTDGMQPYTGMVYLDSFDLQGN